MWYYLTHSWEDKGVHTFPKCICLKVNVIAQLEYKLTYCDFTVHRFNHYTTRTPPQFSISKQFSSIWSIDRTLSGATTPGQSEPGSDGNDRVFCILQSSNITGTSPSDCHIQNTCWGRLSLCRDAVRVFYTPSWLGNNLPLGT